MTKHSVKHELEAAAAAERESVPLAAHRDGRIGTPATYRRHVNALRLTVNNQGMPVYELFMDNDSKFNRWLDFHIDQPAFNGMVPQRLEKQAQYVVDWQIEYQPKNGVLVLLSLTGEPLVLKGLDFNADMQEKWNAELVRIWRKYSIPDKEQANMLAQAFDGRDVADYFAEGHQWSHAVNRLLTVTEAYYNAASLAKAQATVNAYQEEQREKGSELDAWFGPRETPAAPEPQPKPTPKWSKGWWATVNGMLKTQLGVTDSSAWLHELFNVPTMNDLDISPNDAIIRIQAGIEQQKATLQEKTTMTDNLEAIKEQWTVWAAKGRESGYSNTQMLQALSAAMGSETTIKRFGEFKIDGKLGTIEQADAAMRAWIAANTMPELPDADFAAGDAESESAPNPATTHVINAINTYPESPVVVYPKFDGSIHYQGIKFSVTLRLGGTFAMAVALMKEFAKARDLIAPDCLVETQHVSASAPTPASPSLPRPASTPTPQTTPASAAGGTSHIVQIKKAVDEGRVEYHLYEVAGADMAVLRVRKPDIVAATIGRFVDVDALDANTRYSVNWIAGWTRGKINPKNNLPFKDITTLEEA